MKVKARYMLHRMNRTADNKPKVGKNGVAAAESMLAIAMIISPIMGGGAT